MIGHTHICLVALSLAALLSAAPAQHIPSGFRVDRYVSVWERSPFALVERTAPQKLLSPLDNIFLTSWLKDGRREVVLVQNSETNEVQMITATPNQNNLRLVELRLDPNPHSVEAVISDGKERGTVRFRFTEQIPSNGVNSGTAQAVPRVPVESGSRPPPARRKHLLNGVEPERSDSAIVAH
jgi:hypothetical protein